MGGGELVGNFGMGVGASIFSATPIRVIYKNIP